MLTSLCDRVSNVSQPGRVHDGCRNKVCVDRFPHTHEGNKDLWCSFSHTLGACSCSRALSFASLSHKNVNTPGMPMTIQHHRLSNPTQRCRPGNPSPKRPRHRRRRPCERCGKAGCHGTCNIRQASSCWCIPQQQQQRQQQPTCCNNEACRAA